MKFKSSPTLRKSPAPELIASKDQSRPVLTYVHLDVENSRVVVTDSYMLAVFPVDLDEGDTTGPIPLDALKASRKPPNKYADSRILVNGDARVVQVAADGVAGEPYLTVPRHTGEYQFPDVDRLIPDDDKLATFEIAFNAELLAKLAKGMGTDVVKFRFVADEDGNPSALKPIVVTPGNLEIHEDNPHGILMPVRTASRPY
jgi:hypothetical protein